jgi:hypothetical protein
VEHGGENINVYTVLVGKPAGKRQLGRPTLRREEVIKVNLQEIGWEVMDWINLAYNRDRWWAVLNIIVDI